MTKSIDMKREKEKKVIGTMIEIYCKGNHNSRDDLCEECKSVYEYSQLRIDKCPFMESKTFCSNCKVHCYKKEYQEKIKAVMRYSGSRMLLKHPIMVCRHMYLTIKERRHMNRV